MHLIFGALRSIFNLVRCKHHVLVTSSYIASALWAVICSLNTFFWCEARVRHALTAEMSETLLSWGSIHASAKLEGIDGRAPQERVEHVA